MKCNSLEWKKSPRGPKNLLNKKYATFWGQITSFTPNSHNSWYNSSFVIIYKYFTEQETRTVISRIFVYFFLLCAHLFSWYLTRGETGRHHVGAPDGFYLHYPGYQSINQLLKGKIRQSMDEGALKTPIP